MERGYCTESEAKAEILKVAKLHSDNPIVIAAKRTSGINTIHRDVTFVVRCGVDNELLVNALEQLSLTTNRSLSFIGSEVNLQDGQMSIDYLYVTASIKPNLGV